MRKRWLVLALLLGIVPTTMPTIVLAKIFGTITSDENAVVTTDVDIVSNAMLAGSIAASKLIGTDITTIGTIVSGWVPWAHLSDVPSTFAPAAHQLDSATYHTVSGLTAGYFLKAISPTTFGFAAHGLTYADVGALAVAGTAADSDKLDGQHGSYYQSADNINAGTLAVARGGIGVGTLLAHGVLVGAGTSAVVATSVGLTGQLLHGNTGGDPTFSAVDLAVDVTGILPVANGGTGANTAAGARTNLTAAASGANSDITSLVGLSTPLSVSQGGTGSATAGGARTNLSAAASGSNADITALTALSTPLSLAQGGTGATNAAGARSAISAAVLGANNDITSLSGLTTPLAATVGGTSNALYVVGDLLYANATTTLARLAIGSSGAFVRSTGTLPAWSTLILPNSATAYRLPVATSANTIGELAASGATGEYLAGVTGAIPAWATLNQAAVDGLTTASSPVFVTVKLSGLTDGYIPYHVSDAAGLANSPIALSGVKISVGTGHFYATYSGGTIAKDAAANVITATNSNLFSGILLVSYRDSGGNKRSGLIGYFAAGTTVVSVGGTTMSGTKDNAATVNVYYEAGFIVVQNKTANDILEVFITSIGVNPY